MTDLRKKPRLIRNAVHLSAASTFVARGFSETSHRPVGLRSGPSVFSDRLSCLDYDCFAAERG
jgi:hypothetical protein